MEERIEKTDLKPLNNNNGGTDRPEIPLSLYNRPTFIEYLNGLHRKLLTNLTSPDTE